MLTQSFVYSSGVLSAGVAAVICPAPSLVSSTLNITNTGTGPGSGGMVVKYGSAPANILDGVTISEGQTQTLTSEQVSQGDALWGFSTTGTTYQTQQGVGIVPRT
jgi:hypothetical protein